MSLQEGSTELFLPNLQISCVKKILLRVSKTAISCFKHNFSYDYQYYYKVDYEWLKEFIHGHPCQVPLFSHLLSRSSMPEVYVLHNEKEYVFSL